MVYYLNKFESENIMSQLARFGVSIEKSLLNKFDKDIKSRNCPTRSKAIADLIRDDLVKKEWKVGKEVAGIISIVFDHHKRELSSKLTSIQHDFHKLIISTQHIHLDHDNCLEIIVVKGVPKDVEELAQRLKAAKGIKHASLDMASTGKEF